MICSYCRKARAVHEDHIMPHKQKRKDFDFHETVPACFACNIRKGTLRRVPVGYARLEELRELTHQPWYEWNGDPKTLYSESDKQAYENGLRIQQETE